MPASDLDSAISSFCACDPSATREALALPDWKDEDWKTLFGFASIDSVATGEALIRRGERDRRLFFVLRGRIEVVVNSSDGQSMGPLTRIGAGSVLGEQSFFDGRPRSASAWAVDDCEVAAMSPEQFAALEESHPALARELLFALGCILAIRLRRTTEKVLG